MGINDRLRVFSVGSRAASVHVTERRTAVPVPATGDLVPSPPVSKMSSLSRMLLVYDGTNEANAALARCASLSRALSATVDVVAIVDNATANARSAGLLSELAHQHLAESARRDLQRAVDTLTDDGIAARGYLRFGRAADVVAGHASTTCVDMIVVGYRAPTGFARWWRERLVHVDLAERVPGAALVVVTIPST